ncbi:MAG TPA: SigB/SigF/SigG family RNA polymerase sigma factor [Actinomycetales bacterium]|nr:SigB/SigF/SigG family RNA polymerase sigma factor [Actinomycetales bacterium]
MQPDEGLQTEVRLDGRPDLRSEVDELLHAAARCSCPDEQQRLRAEAVTAAMPLARSIALRYRGRGESMDDLVQVAYLGLVKAVSRFDPERGSDFIAFATPSITGEVRRWFRDRGWDVRPPRRLQDLRATMLPAVQELAQELGRSPKSVEVAEKLGVSTDEVLETMQAVTGYTADSLDAPVDREEGPTLGETLGGTDAELDDIEDRLSLGPLLAQLPPRDRHILSLRFYRGWTQSEIAEDIGVTQMQVSRLLTKALSRLREQLLAS